MKLLFDQNLSPRLIDLLAAEFTGFAHHETVVQLNDDPNTGILSFF